MTVEQLAAARGRSVDEVLAACRTAQVLAWGASTPLLESEVRSIDAVLGTAPAPPPPPGVNRLPAYGPPPGSAPGPPPPPPPGPPPGPGPWMPPGPPPPFQTWPVGGALPAPPRRGMSTGATVGVGLAIGAGGLILLLVLAVAFLGEKSSSRFTEVEDVIDEPTVTTDAAEGDLVDGAFSLEEGDCFTGTTDLSSVSCDRPHDGEVYAVVVHPGDIDDTFPGDDAVATFADSECFSRFEGFVGRRYVDSTLDFQFIYPTEVGWDRLDDREVLCVVVTMDGSQLTGSSRGSGR